MKVMIASVVYCCCGRKENTKATKKFIANPDIDFKKPKRDQYQNELTDILTQHVLGIKLTEIHLNFNPFRAARLFLYPLQTQTTELF